MTMRQNPQQPRFKPLKIALTSIIVSTFSLAFNPSAEAALTDTTHVMTNSQAPSSSTNTNTTEIISPTPTGTPAPIDNKIENQTTTTTSTKPATTPTPPAATVSNTGVLSPATAASQTTANVPLNQANMSDAAILNWASDVAKLAYSYDFKNYNKQMQLIQNHFTSKGWTAFMNALNKSNNLNVVQNRKLVASATNNGKATILQQGVRNGVYTWKILIPLLATYESESRLIRQNLEVTLLIVRDNSDDGVGVSHFVATIVPASQPITTSPTATTSTTTAPSPTTGIAPPATTTTQTTTTTTPSVTTPSATPSTGPGAPPTPPTMTTPAGTSPNVTAPSTDNTSAGGAGMNY